MIILIHSFIHSLIMSQFLKQDLENDNHLLLIDALSDSLLKVRLLINSELLIKYCQTVDILEDFSSSLAVFKNAETIVGILKDRANYEIDEERMIFFFNWKVVTRGCEIKICTEFHLEKQEINKEDHLQFENHVLKRTIKNIKKETPIEISNSQDKFSIPPKVQEPLFMEENKPRKTIDIFDIQGVTEKEKAAKVERADEKDEANKADERNHSQYIESSDCEEINKVIVKKKIIKKSEGHRINKNIHKKDKNNQICLDKLSYIKGQISSQKGAEKISQIHNIIQKQIEGVKYFIKRKQLNKPQKIRIDFQNQDYYEGQIMNNMFHGKGIYISPEIGTYYGEWNNGSAAGKGTSIDKKGNRHTGMYQSDMKNGYGKEVYHNDETYEGEFRDNQRDGFGVYTFVNGNKYEGHWKNNFFEGKGKFTQSNGSTFEGLWKNDLKDGSGIFTNSKGSSEVQQWKNGNLIVMID